MSLKVSFKTVEERDLNFIDALLPELSAPYIRADVPHCYFTGGDLSHTSKPYGLVLVDGEQLMGGMCVADKKAINRPAGTQFIYFSILSVNFKKLHHVSSEAERADCGG